MATCIKANGKTIWPMEQAYLLILWVPLMMASGLMICSTALVKNLGKQGQSSSKVITSKDARKDKESMNGKMVPIIKVSLSIAASTVREFIILQRAKKRLRGTLLKISSKAKAN